MNNVKAKMNGLRKIPFEALLFYGTKIPYHPGKWLVHHKLCEFFKMEDLDIDFEMVRDGITWILNPSDYVQRSLFWMGEKDRWDIMHIKGLLRKGDTIFDVGANFGFYAITLAMALQKECNIFAFEPNPPTFDRLTHHVKVNYLENIVKIERLGLSDMACDAIIKDFAGNTGHSTVFFSGEGAAVHLVTLDEYCASRQIERLDFLKIDIEGFEERALLGGQTIIDRYHPLILTELNPGCLEMQNSSVERVAGLLEQLGYRLYHSLKDRLVPLENLPSGGDVIDTLAIHRNSERYQ